MSSSFIVLFVLFILDSQRRLRCEDESPAALPLHPKPSRVAGPRLAALESQMIIRIRYWTNSDTAAGGSMARHSGNFALIVIAAAHSRVTSSRHFRRKS